MEDESYKEPADINKGRNFDQPEQRLHNLCDTKAFNILKYYFAQKSITLKCIKDIFCLQFVILSKNCYMGQFDSDAYMDIITLYYSLEIETTKETRYSKMLFQNFFNAMIVNKNISNRHIHCIVEAISKNICAFTKIHNIQAIEEFLMRIIDSNCCNHNEIIYILISYYRQTNRSFIFQCLSYDVLYSIITEEQSDILLSYCIILANGERLERTINAINFDDALIIALRNQLIDINQKFITTLCECYINKRFEVKIEILKCFIYSIRQNNEYANLVSNYPNIFECLSGEKEGDEEYSILQHYLYDLYNLMCNIITDSIAFTENIISICESEYNSTTVFNYYLYKKFHKSDGLIDVEKLNLENGDHLAQLKKLGIK